MQPAASQPRGWPKPPRNSPPPQATPAQPATLQKYRPGPPGPDPRAGHQAPNRFPINGFTYSFTLSSECFSSFLHSTCALSVSCPYLALDEHYHPLGAAFPNSPTRQPCLIHCVRCGPRGSHPLRRRFPNTLFHTACTDDTSKLQFRARGASGLGFGLFPLHSPLLGESLLVSFPPLIDMLKFSGCSCLM